MGLLCAGNLKIIEVAHIFVSAVNITYALILKKMHWASFWVISGHPKFKDIKSLDRVGC
jgi:hypothetical protein